MNDSSAARWAAAAAEAAKRVSKVRSKFDEQGEHLVASSPNNNTNTTTTTATSRATKTSTIQTHNNNNQRPLSSTKQYLSDEETHNAYENGRNIQQTSNQEASLKQGLAELDAVRSFLRDGINRCNASFMNHQQRNNNNNSSSPTTSSMSTGGNNNNFAGAAAGAATLSSSSPSNNRNSNNINTDATNLHSTLQKGLYELEEVRHKLLASLASGTNNTNTKPTTTSTTTKFGVQAQEQTRSPERSLDDDEDEGFHHQSKKSTTTKAPPSTTNNTAPPQPPSLSSSNNNNSTTKKKTLPPNPQQRKTLFGSSNSRPTSAPAWNRQNANTINTENPNTNTSSGSSSLNNSNSNLPRSAGFTTKLGNNRTSGVNGNNNNKDENNSSNNTSTNSNNNGGTSSWGERLLQRAQQRRMSRHRQAVEQAGVGPTNNNNNNSRPSSANSNNNRSSGANNQQAPPPTNNGSLFARSLNGNSSNAGSRQGSFNRGRPTASGLGSRRNSTNTNNGSSSSSYFPKDKDNNKDDDLFVNDDDDDENDDATTDDSMEEKLFSSRQNNSNKKSSGVPRPPNRPATSTNTSSNNNSSSSFSGLKPDSNANSNIHQQQRPASATNVSSTTAGGGAGGGVNGIRQALKRPSSAYFNAHNQATATESVNSNININTSSDSSNNSKPSSAQQQQTSKARPATSTTPSTTASSNNQTNNNQQSGTANRPASAAPTSSSATKGLSPEAQTLREQGNVQFQAKKYADAVETYSRALSYAPRSETLLCNRAAANLMLHRFSDALRDSQRAADIDQSLTKAHWRAAKSALFLGQSDTAKQHYTIAQRQALSQSDADAIATELKMVDVADRCRRSIRAKDFGEALRSADALLQVFPVSSPCASVWLCLKIEALLPTDANEALAIAVNTTETDPLSAEAWITRAKCTFYTGHDAASTSASQGFLTKAKELDQACGHRAITLQAAIETFAKLRDDGNSAYTAGRWLDAHNAYSKCLTIDPNNVSLRAIILCNRAAVAIQRNMWSEALEDIDQSIRLNPTNAKAFTRRARIHQHFNKLDAAIRDLQTAVTIFPSPENQERLAQALEARTNQNEQNSNSNNYQNNNNNNIPRPSSRQSRPGSAQPNFSNNNNYQRPGSAAPNSGTNNNSRRPSSSAGFRFFAFGGAGNNNNNNTNSRPGSAAGFRPGGGGAPGSRPQSASGMGSRSNSNNNNMQPPPPPPQPQQPCLYATLGVSRGCDDKTIVKAYRDAALRWHPDKWSTANENEKKVAEMKFKDIANAYNILKDQPRRRQYDVSGSY